MDSEVWQMLSVYSGIKNHFIKGEIYFPQIVGHVNIQLLMNDSNFEELKSEELYNFINLTFLNKAYCWIRTRSRDKEIWI